MAEPNAREDWSDDELRASVLAYLDMQRRAQNGLPFVKKNYYSDLGEKFGRNPKAFERRMMNISHVMDTMGREYLKGLLPARNVGANVAATIERLIEEAEGNTARPLVPTPIAPTLSPMRQGKKPTGVRAPTREQALVTLYQRDPAVVDWVLKEANGRCDCCGRPAPFHGSDGLPFLEVHHVKQLANGGSDTVNQLQRSVDETREQLAQHRRASEPPPSAPTNARPR